MRMTISVEDAGPPTLEADASAPTDAATPPLDAGVALGAETADAAPGADVTADGGQAPAWLVELLEGLGGEADAAEPTDADAGAGPGG